MSKTAFIYPGQGAQKCGMGLDFYETYAGVKELYDSACDYTGMDLKHLCFEENDDINITRFTQPALTLTELAITRACKEEGLSCQVTAGLSLGEYSAIVTAGALSELDAVKLTMIRGQLMESCVPAGEGAMAAVIGLEADVTKSVTDKIEGAYTANFNCPGQQVISGTPEGVKEAGEALKAAGARRVIPLNVSGPFHSPLLKKAGDDLAGELVKTKINKLDMPYAANVSGEYVNDSELIRDLLAKQVYSSVRFEECVRNMYADGVDTFVEIGPGKTLAGFVRKICPEAAVFNIDTVEKLKEAVECLKERQL